MVRPASAYLSQLQALLPFGAAWTREPGAYLTRLLDAMAQEPARLDARAALLLEEADPRTAYELLDDWERVLGLPDPCTIGANSIGDRQLAAWRKLAFQAGQTPAFYMSMAAAMGFSIEVHEFDPDVDDHDPSLAAEVAAGRWRYIWRVHVLDVGSLSYFRFGDEFGGRFREGDGATVIECLITSARPAHTHVIFSYEEA